MTEREIINEWVYEISETTQATIDNLLYNETMIFEKRQECQDAHPIHIRDLGGRKLAIGVILGRLVSELVIEAPFAATAGERLILVSRQLHRQFVIRVLGAHPMFRETAPQGHYIIMALVEATKPTADQINHQNNLAR